MADISQHTDNILNASRGETVRDSIISAARAIDSDTEYAELLDGSVPTDYVFYVDETAKLDCDAYPIEGSIRPVESNWLYDAIGDIFDSEQVESTQLIARILQIDDISQSILSELNEKIMAANMPSIPWYDDPESGTRIYYYPWLYIAPTIQSLYARQYIDLDVRHNGVYEAPTGIAYRSITVNVLPTEPVPYSGIITQNGTYEAPPGYSYTQVTVEVPPQPFTYSYNRSTGIAHAQGIFYSTKEQEGPNE